MNVRCRKRRYPTSRFELHYPYSADDFRRRLVELRQDERSYRSCADILTADFSVLVTADDAFRCFRWMESRRLLTKYAPDAACDDDDDDDAPDDELGIYTYNM